MKVLLINTNREHAPQPVVPLGLCIVASALEARGFQPKLLDLCFARHPENEIPKAIAAWQPSAIGISIRNMDNGEYMEPRGYLPFAAEVARLCRQYSEAPLIVGGPAVSVAPARVLETVGADYAVAGEGEEVFPELLARLHTGGSVSEIPGIYARTPSQLPSVPAARLDSLEAVPDSQAGSWLDLRRYLRWGSPLPVQSKRGCALKCIHCTYRQIEGEKYRFRPPEAVVEQMLAAKRLWGVRRFEFVDSTFNHPPRHALALCEEIVRKELCSEIYTMGLNPAGISKELMMLMKQAGFNSILCTPDSGSDRMLDSLRKGFGAEQVAQTAAWAQEANLSILWSFMFGGPGESEETVRETLKLIQQNIGPRDRILCTVGLRIYPNTELETIARSEGRVKTEDNLMEPIFYFSPDISPQRVLEMLESSSWSSKMVYLGLLQRQCIPIALRVKAALRLPGALWNAIPLYNYLLNSVGARRRYRGRS